MTHSEKKLKTGFTTGTAAAAAVKAALCFLLHSTELRSDKGCYPSQVQISLLTGDLIFIPVHKCELTGEKKALCTVIKDAGDDPDITHKAEIGAIVSLSQGNGGITITGGQGVGTVTKPGLEIPPGEAAINPGPLKMIRQAVREALSLRQAQGAAHDSLMAESPDKYSVHVEIFVPEGEKLAHKTLNSKLGIIGGISILGTTGIVRPMSHDAYIATIRSAMSVARAAGLEHAVLTTGRRSERYAQALLPELPEEAFIQIGDFFQLSMQAASEMKFKQIYLTVFFGKAVKMAQGVPHTHAAKSSLTMYNLAKWALDITGDPDFSEKISKANTARHAFDFISESHPEIIAEVGKRMVKSAKGFASPDIQICGIIFDFNGKTIYSEQ